MRALLLALVVLGVTVASVAGTAAAEEFSIGGAVNISCGGSAGAVVFVDTSSPGVVVVNATAPC